MPIIDLQTQDPHVHGIKYREQALSFAHMHKVLTQEQALGANNPFEMQTHTQISVNNRYVHANNRSTS